MFCQLSAHHIGEEKVQVRAQVEVVIIISEALGVHAYLIVGFESEVHLHHPLSAPAHHFVLQFLCACRQTSPSVDQSHCSSQTVHHLVSFSPSVSEDTHEEFHS
jgi:hypothetical protein